jgi:hypothetical protein
MLASRHALLMLAALLAAACATPVGMSDDAGLDVGLRGDVDAARVDANADAAGLCAVADVDLDHHDATACGGDDCEDGDANRFPGNPEVCDTTGHDEDCDPTTFGTTDSDHDGHVAGTCCNTDAVSGMRCGDDCDDSRVGVHPDAPEVCNAIDDDCDSATDEALLSSYTADCDGDHYGAGTPTVQCAAPVAAPAACPAGSWVTVSGDCDDADSAVSPARAEVCDAAGRDEDCEPATLGPDGDGDGVVSVWCCDTQPDGNLLCGNDCDDRHSAVHPAAVEICDFIDDDCNGLVDDVPGCPPDPEAGRVRCGPTLTCTPAQGCCSGGAGGAMDGPFGCGGTPACTGDVFARCDGPEDCAGGQSCCPSGGLMAPIICMPSGDARCSITRFCTHDGQCPTGVACMVGGPFEEGDHRTCGGA